MIVDGSRSFDADDCRAGLSALAAALSHQRDGRVAVLVFDWQIHRLFPGFRAVASATPDLVDLTFASRNGSQVDAALLEADAILQAEAPPTAPRRILIVTDLRTRMALRPADLRLRSGAIVHVGVAQRGATRAGFRSTTRPGRPSSNGPAASSGERRRPRTRPRPTR